MNKGILQARSEKNKSVKISDKWYNADKVFAFLPQNNNIMVQYTTTSDDKEITYIKEYKDNNFNNANFISAKKIYENIKEDKRKERIELMKIITEILKIKKDDVSKLSLNDIVKLVEALSDELNEFIYGL